MDNRAARTKREVTDCMVDGEPWRTGTLRLARGPGITSGRGINIVVVDLGRCRKCQHPQAKYCRYVLFHRITLGAEVRICTAKTTEPHGRTEDIRLSWRYPRENASDGEQGKFAQISYRVPQVAGRVVPTH